MTKRKTKRMCPVCKSENMFFFIGGQTGSYRCHDCGYIGPIVIYEEKLNKKKNSKESN